MDEKQKKVVVIVVAVIAILAALGFIISSATAPTETQNRFKDVPPKGAGKYDKGKD